MNEKTLTLLVGGGLIVGAIAWWLSNPQNSQALNNWLSGGSFTGATGTGTGSGAGSGTSPTAPNSPTGGDGTQQGNNAAVQMAIAPQQYVPGLGTATITPTSISFGTVGSGLGGIVLSQPNYPSGNVTVSSSAPNFHGNAVQSVTVSPSLARSLLTETAVGQQNLSNQLQASINPNTVAAQIVNAAKSNYSPLISASGSSAAHPLSTSGGVH